VNRSHSAWERGDYTVVEGVGGETVVRKMNGQSKPDMEKRRNALPPYPG
jgi:hypothetical protein